jgi:hypothetical protein
VAGKARGHLFQDRFLRWGNLHGRHPILGCQLIDRPLPRNASRAILALHSARCCRRGIAITAFLLIARTNLTNWVLQIWGSSASPVLGQKGRAWGILTDAIDLLTLSSRLRLHVTHVYYVFTGVRDKSGEPARSCPHDYRTDHAAHSQLPALGASSPRSHRDDTRRPRDLPLWEYAVCVVLHSRRFRCVHATCTPPTCTAHLPPIVRPAAPRTVRLTPALQPLGLALGDEAGARLSDTLHMSTRPDTLLRLVHRLPEPPIATPAILGVDG